MSKSSIAEDSTTLSMALIGFEMEKARLNEKIAEIHAHLGQSSGSASTKKAKPAASASAAASAHTNGTGAPVKKRTMSAGARKRIAAAQRKRWAEHRKNLAATA